MKGRTYRYFTGKPVYPFGYGLSYTTFSYAPISVEPINGPPENGLRVTTQVSNTGSRDGDEVAELYLTPPQFDGAPRLALRGFKRVSLNAGRASERDVRAVSARSELRDGGRRPTDCAGSLHDHCRIGTTATRYRLSNGRLRGDDHGQAAGIIETARRGGMGGEPCSGFAVFRRFWF